jgi:hypothetical protein
MWKGLPFPNGLGPKKEVSMKRPSKVILAALAALVLGAGAFASVSVAASPHFKHGGTPKCTITSTGTSADVVCSGVLAGLGGDDLQIDVTVSGFAVYQCQNPSEKNTPPGQNKVLVGPVTEPTNISGDEVKNGNLSFTTDAATLAADDTVTGTEAGCNNDKWTGVNPTLTVTSIQLVIQQPVGTTIFTCSASDSKGLKSPVTLTCVPGS